VLAAASLLAVFARLVLSLRDNAGMLVASRYEALTDALTGLGNRRALTRDLDRVAAGQHEGAVLALFDLDGFKHYNDSYGHPAGDALLQRLGAKLGAHVVGAGSAYRMGGDEFCVLLGVGADPVAQGADCAGALSEHGDGFVITCSFGVITVPGEAQDAGEALRIADQRMYAHKHSGRSSARNQSPRRAAARAGRTQPRAGRAHQRRGRAGRGRRAAPEPRREQIDHVPPRRRVARRRQDGHPRRDPRQARRPRRRRVEFIRRHTIIGERIVAAAPALRPVAALVRSSHERWDGAGYPDSLAGEDIPLGARIVSVCDAFDAMVADRPYRAGMAAADALVELERCSGSQFDPGVVAAFVAAWAGQPVLRAAA
jgi:diguanylate cyclase (GGDEF)-like protein